MAGRAGRRGIDTVGHVVHCNNLFDIPTLTEYQQILCGKPKKLISKFHIHYNMILNLIKTEKSIDFQSFVNQSMVYDELQKNIRGSNLEVTQKNDLLQKKDDSIKLSKTPMEICLTYIDTTDNLCFYKNKQRKQAELDIRNLEDTYRSIKEDSNKIREYKKLDENIRKDKCHIDYLENSISTQISDICNILKQNGFITHDNKLTTPLGQTAANIHEVHPLLMGELLQKTQFFKEFSMIQIASFLSIFTQVNVLEEERILHIPNISIKEKTVI
jgi:superfamily II RNA helicase